MLGLISTENLFILELGMIEDIKYNSDGSSIISFNQERRYALAKKCGFGFFDVFTSSMYKLSSISNILEECVISSKTIITDRKYITKKEGILLLKELNPNYENKKGIILKKLK